MAGVSGTLLAGDAGLRGVMGHALHQMDTQVSPLITAHLATGFCLPRFFMAHGISGRARMQVCVARRRERR